MVVLANRSVRSRVTIIAAVIVAVVLAIVAVAIVLVQQRVLSTAVDDGLRRRADDLAAIVVTSVPDSLVGVDDDTAAQLTTREGVVLVASPNLVGEAAIGVNPTFGSDVLSERLLVNPDDTFRVLSRRIESDPDPVILHVATAMDDVSDSISALRNSLLVAIPLTVAALAAIIWVMVGRALQPVEAITREVEVITDSDLSRRVSVPDTDDEIERLASTMNGMLDRLERGADRRQQFVADASHELRSPLTRIRSELEVDMANPGSSDLVATHRSVLDETVAMEELVADLLFLARSDADRQTLRADPVDLDDLLLSEAELQRSTAGVRIDVSGVSGGQVVGDRAQLRRVISNLSANAARYASSAVHFSLHEEGGSVVLSVSDDGPGINVEDRKHVFERFTRADEARSRDHGGSGLGLAIARDIIVRHSGSITIDAEHSPGTRFVIRLPRS